MRLAPILHHIDVIPGDVERESWFANLLPLVYAFINPSLEFGRGDLHLDAFAASSALLHFDFLCILTLHQW
ncbi:hypothetical protein Y032_0009g590 [Ancylostoma ceylanicum]|uniref:Uncharacterized protein n=1 Tax=Ancylostoma ceylanicum TaxID=53326 RepID=A0A016VIH0_9BILA|nr:hypothetical protein Y032_0009g590 [Ancylostoma ceylanicum]